MADLTIFSPQPFIPLPVSSVSNVSVRHAARVGHGPISNQPASSSDFQSSNDPQYDPSLLSPPLHTYRSRRKARSDVSDESQRSSSHETLSQSGEEEDATDSTEDDQDPVQTRSHSYTESFLPFSYPSTPRTIQIPSHSQGGLRPPAPPLFRPKTFWRHTRRSALTGLSYSPSSHIVRRSTFIAAGLSLDTPHADLSALSVELRTGTISLVPSTALLL